MVVWALLDDRAGNVSQARGVASKLGVPFEEKHINYNRLAALPNLMRGTSLLGVDVGGSSPLEFPWPDVVIAAGRRSAPVARYIKRKNPNAKLIQIMWPGAPTADFDLIAVPVHDEGAEGPRVIRTLLAPHTLTQQTLQEAGETLQSKLAHLPRPWVAVLVGGTSKHGAFSPEQARALMHHAHLQAGHGSLLVTTSRRTGTELESQLRVAITRPHVFYGWGEEGENPYTGFLALADKILVTADSISMMSEACYTGKPVTIVPLFDPAPKHTRFIEALYRAGLAQPLGSTSGGIIAKNEEVPLDSASDIASRIRLIGDN